MSLALPKLPKLLDIQGLDDTHKDLANRVWEWISAAQDVLRALRTSQNTITNTLNTLTSAPHQIVDFVFARSYGGYWDGLHNDQPVIQAALDDLKARGIQGFVILPPVAIRIGASITLHDGTGLKGSLAAVPGSDGPVGTNLLWYGPGGGTIINAWGRDMALKSLRITVPTGQTANRAIDATARSLLANGLCTAHEYESLYISGDNTNLTDGIVIGDLTNTNPTYPSNCENFLYRRVTIFGVVNAGVRCPNTTGQAKTHRFEHCAFLFGAWGIWADRLSFHMYAPSFAGLTVCLHVEHPTDPMYADGCDVESCSRLYSDGGDQGACVPTSFSGRFDMNGALAADGYYIQMGAGGPLILNGCRFAIAAGSNFAIYNTTTNPHTVTARGSLFPVIAGGDIMMFKTGGGAGIQDLLTILDITGCMIQDTNGTALRKYAITQN